jgi:UDP-N-acetylglucosamine acyltransferase
MTLQIHSTAIVDPLADLAPDVSVGPYAVIGPRVRIGETTSIGPHSVIVCNTRIGAGCSIGVGSVLGGEPQDRKYHHEETWLEIGDETVIRDYSTLNRGTGARGTTSIGRGCFLMTYVHVAHDCVIENGVVIANAVQLAGHVYVEEYATLGGSTPVHQFVRIGTHAMIGGGSRLPQDVPPYTRAAGNPYKLYGINVIGLTRAGFSAEVRLALKHAYRLLFNSDLPRTEAAERLRQEMRGVPEVQRLIDFVASSERGVLA